jgi:uncharacterized OB-fold protein
MMPASDEILFERYPSTPIDHDNKDFYRGLLARHLMLNRCEECGRWHNPPLPMCPDCWSTDVRATQVSGEGIVYLLTLMHQGPPTPGVDYSTPHPVAAIELAEQTGLRFTSAIVNCDPRQVHIGMAVRLAWQVRDGNPFPVFEPAVGPDEPGSGP